MFLLQSAVILIIVKAYFFDKIFSHNKFFGLIDLMTELTIFFYLWIGMVSSYYGVENVNRYRF